MVFLSIHIVILVDDELSIEALIKTGKTLDFKKDLTRSRTFWR